MQITADGQVAEIVPAMPPLIDLQMGPDGTLYALSYGLIQSGQYQPEMGMIWRIPQDGMDVTYVVDSLSYPTGFAFDEDGNAYITVGGGTTGVSGQLLLIEDLIHMEGHTFDWE